MFLADSLTGVDFPYSRLYSSTCDPEDAQLLVNLEAIFFCLFLFTFFCFFLKGGFPLDVCLFLSLWTR